MPGRLVRCGLAGEHAVDELPQPLPSGRIRMGRQHREVGFFSLGRFEAGDVERPLVAEVVVDGGDARPRLATDVADAGPIETASGESGTGDLDQSVLEILCHGVHPMNKQTKRSFQSTVINDRLVGVKTLFLRYFRLLQLGS